jgi:crossover junction endodeoxyribonuclease RusA
MIRIRLPWPPSINHYWRNVAGRTLISSNGRDYRQSVVGLVLRQPIRIKRFDGRVRVCIYASPPDRRRRDLDNLCKPMLDALTHAGVWADDSQIDDLRIIRCPPAPGGVIELEVGDVV